jgi:23S rRNA pseudouridine1911/1915/1917 synthase
LSRREVNDLLDAAQVSIGGRVVTSRSRKVHAGERVSAEGSLLPDAPHSPTPDRGVDVNVVWSDDSVIVVDKPAGLVVHPGAGHSAGTLVHGLLARFPDLAALDSGERPGIVHRLDKGTSGLLMVARTPEATAALTAQLASRHVERQYLALVAGTVEADSGLIDAPLGRANRDPTRIRVQAGGRGARTRYEVEDRFDRPEPTTLLRCRLETGRTHQIRVHLAAIGHPVVGDDRYGGGTVEGWQPLPRGRPFLHAATLGFVHPISGERMSFSSPMPVDLLSVLAGVSHSADG